MTLYSIDGAYPGPLPVRHRLSNGSTRTSLGSLTSQELADLDPPIIAISDPGTPAPATQKLTWDGTTLAIVAKTVGEQESYIDAVADAHLAALATHRYEGEFGGFTLDGAPVRTDVRTREVLNRARRRADADSEATVRWKVGGQTFTTLSAAQVIAIDNAVDQFIQDWYQAESDAVGAVTALRAAAKDSEDPTTYADVVAYDPVNDPSWPSTAVTSS